MFARSAIAKPTGIGDAIDADKSPWIHSFDGRSLADIALAADGGSIDVISGASVTSRAVVNGVHDALADAQGAPSWSLFECRR